MGDSGNCVQIKGLLPADKEVIYWTTDRMPQEHLSPIYSSCNSQCDTLVSWPFYPCGVYPDPNNTKIVKGNKFVKNLLEVFSHEPFFENDPQDKKPFFYRLNSKISKETHSKVYSN